MGICRCTTGQPFPWAHATIILAAMAITLTGLACGPDDGNTAGTGPRGYIVPGTNTYVPANAPGVPANADTYPVSELEGIGYHAAPADALTPPKKTAPPSQPQSRPVATGPRPSSRPTSTPPIVGPAPSPVSPSTPRPTPSAVNTPKPDTVFIAPHSGTKYHKKRDCIGLRNAKAIEEIPLAEAKRKGYEPCKRCH